ncbi:PHB depolymerase family esterase [Janthinobacterium sp. 17J80-10]|uniref:extracellular catalytic domain type 1 short-chain-length polyhydroxyalkanoate depolymerase n=1 Tax=Janthinobacterium sp. 17J80-10 TaxID=2497863 RepID=UPI001005788A|nr:PHB depolymerase family esterase [Janthinobacterium sp. 17J80-10]QAU33701.1 PHB depolymerase family esterase [Janthinobacterium sp. 17J80-10]
MRLNDTMFATMREATQLLQSQGPMAATAAIQRALQGAGLSGGMPHFDWNAPPMRAPGTPLHDINPAPEEKSGAVPQGADILSRLRNLAGGKWAGKSAAQPVEDVVFDRAPGQFLAGSCSNSAGTRSYKLYIPSGYTGQEEVPLIVMLHGCKQNPDDFAAGTRMNQVAEENNCLVVYPGQVQGANMSNCWNWFKAGEQQRDRGEPSIIADITRKILADYKVDGRRVYIAGLSAGGAMAAIMADSYPELYAAVGIHSGLPAGAAHDLPSAFAAMRGASPGRRKSAPASGKGMPVIVFHGDRDHTVNPSNGEQALAQCAADGTTAPVGTTEPGIKVEKGQVPNGRSFTRSIQVDDKGNPVAEHWVVHGAGHAWSGGSRQGSYTDPQGPNAAKEMVRFFTLQRRA